MVYALQHSWLEKKHHQTDLLGNPLNSPCLLLFSTENNLSYFGFLLGKKIKKGRVGLLWPLEPRRAANAPPCLFGTKN